jgi:hypothetical protein
MEGQRGVELPAIPEKTPARHQSVRFEAGTATVLLLKSSRFAESVSLYLLNLCTYINTKI